MHRRFLRIIPRRHHPAFVCCVGRPHVNRLCPKIVALVVNPDQIANGVFAAPGLQLTVVQRHRLRSGSATGFAVAARSLSYKFNNVLFNRRPRLPTRWGQRWDDQRAKEGQKENQNSLIPTSM
jgi:hypothetical protein